MKDLKTINETFLLSLDPLQRFWLDLWAELLQPSTIDIHALPPVNCRTLVSDILYLGKEDIEESRKKSHIGEAIIELYQGSYGFYKDALITKEFQETVLAETMPNVKKMKTVSPMIQCSEKIARNLLDNNDYSSKLFFNVYKRISVDYVFENSWLNEAKQLESMTKSMFIELLKMGFSYNYLKMKFIQFIQGKSFFNDNIQSKVDSLFLGFIANTKTYNLVFKLFDFPQLSSNQKVQNIELASNIPNYVKAGFEERINNIEKELEKILWMSETDIFNKIISHIEELIGKEQIIEKQIIKHTRDIFEITCKNRNNNELRSLDEIASFVGYFTRLIEQLRANYNSKPSGSSNYLTRDQLLCNSPQKLYKFANKFDLDFVLSDSDQIKKICGSISKNKSINILKSYLLRFYGLRNMEKEKEKLLQVLSLLKSHNKIQFAIITDVRARDIFSAVKIGNEKLNGILSYLQFEYGHLRGDIVKKCVVYHHNITELKTSIINIEDTNPQKHIIKKNFEQPRRFTERLNLIQSYPHRIFFENILSWYGYSMQKNNKTNKFLTLWIALESLLTKEIEESEGPFIAETGSNILGLYLVRKVIRNLSADLRRLSLDNDIANNFSVTITEEGINETDLLYIIITQGKKLEKSLKNDYCSELLSYRVNEYRKLFSSPYQIRKTIEYYTRQVKWNLLRHYSLRNRIVHTGYQVSNIAYYQFQLDYYFRIIIENVIHFCIIHPNKSISENIKSFKGKYDFYLQNMEEKLIDWKKNDFNTDDFNTDDFKTNLHRVIIDQTGSK